MNNMRRLSLSITRSQSKIFHPTFNSIQHSWFSSAKPETEISNNNTFLSTASNKHENQECNKNTPILTSNKDPIEIPMDVNVEIVDDNESEIDFSSILDSKLEAMPNLPLNPIQQTFSKIVFDGYSRMKYSQFSKYEQILMGEFGEKSKIREYHYYYHFRDDRISNYDNIGTEDEMEYYSNTEQNAQSQNSLKDILYDLQSTLSSLDINDVLQTHVCMDSSTPYIVTDTVDGKSGDSICLAKSTGALNELLDSADMQQKMEVRNDKKWKVHKMRKHILKKRRGNKRQKKIRQNQATGKKKTLK